jgi:hypothetical protein
VDDYKEEDEEEDGFGGARERRSLVNGAIILRAGWRRDDRA